MITDTPKELARCVKKTVQGFSARQISKFPGTLHAYRELDKTRLRLLGFIAKTDAKIVLMKIDKNKLRRRFPRKNDIELYMYVVTGLFENATRDEILSGNDEIVLSRFFTKKSQNAELVESIAAETNMTFCSVAPAYGNKCRQVVDFVAWAYYMKYERNEPKYIEVISDKIIIEYAV
jgi:hypothetical protein